MGGQQQAISITRTCDSEQNTLSLCLQSAVKCITDSVVCVCVCVGVPMYGIRMPVDTCPLLRAGAICMHSFCGAENVNELPNSTIRL